MPAVLLTIVEMMGDILRGLVQRACIKTEIAEGARAKDRVAVVLHEAFQRLALRVPASSHKFLVHLKRLAVGCVLRPAVAELPDWSALVGRQHRFEQGVNRAVRLAFARLLQSELKAPDDPLDFALDRERRSSRHAPSPPSTTCLENFSLPGLLNVTTHFDLLNSSEAIFSSRLSRATPRAFSCSTTDRSSARERPSRSNRTSPTGGIWQGQAIGIIRVGTPKVGTTAGLPRRLEGRRFSGGGWGGNSSLSLSSMSLSSACGSVWRASGD